jgi:hypothetical protein
MLRKVLRHSWKNVTQCGVINNSHLIPFNIWMAVLGNDTDVPLTSCYKCSLFNGVDIDPN